MDRVKVLANVVKIIFIAFILSLITGIFSWKVLPKTVLGLQKGIWINIHVTISFIFVGLAIYHIILHWNWIKNIVFKK